MAQILYRVGRFSRRHPWPVVGTWLLLLALTLTGAVTLKGTMANQFRIPGASFQTVADTLKAKLPVAAGDSGTIVVTTSSGTFTPAQEAAVGRTVREWSRVPGVGSVTDPFPLQKQLDTGPAQLVAAREKLGAAKTQLAAGKAKLRTATGELTQQQRALDARRAGLPAGTPAPAPMTAAQQQLDAARAALSTQSAQLAAGEAKLTTQERELAVAGRQAALVKGTRVVSSDHRAALVQLRFRGQASSVPSASRTEIQRVGGQLAASGLTVDYGSTIVGDLSSIIGPGEMAGVGIAALVLVVMLGTLVAAGLPLLMAIVGVAVGIGGTLALSGVVSMNSITPALALMLGLAVGIDYSLFILNRHRTQLLSGMPAEESIPRANGTSGNAVVFAGLTVVIALAALTVTGIPFLAVMGLAGAATVAMAVLVAVTLTPAVLALAGPRVLGRRAWRAHGFTAAGEPVEASPSPTGAGADGGTDRADGGTDGPVGGTDGPDGSAVRGRRGWGELVTSRPWAGTLASLVLLGVCAIPAVDLRLGLPDGGSEPVGSTAHEAYTLTGKYFGEGANGPIVAVATLPSGLDRNAAQAKMLDVAGRLAGVTGVVRVLPIGISDDRRVAAVQVVTERGPAEPQTVDVVEALRAAGDGVREATGAELGLTGQTVANIDVSAKLADALAPYLAIVVGLSLILLIMVFRSLVVPLVATGGFLMSVAAAFGAVVAVYQWGWLGGVFGVSNPEAVLSFLPTLLIGVLFGLAMDYQMFLVSGMREAYAHGQAARRAVLTGFHHGARVVTAAALIMISVFAGFIFAQLTMIRPIGFGLAFGVLVDAFVVRLTLTPAVMHLLGDRAWRLPGWLDRIVPDVDVEGAKLASRMPDASPEPHRVTASV